MTSFIRLLKQGICYPSRFIKGRIQKSDLRIKDIRKGEGAIVEQGGEKVAVYAGEELITLSPVCTHLGCIVAWNTSEKTWDCPCHGSRYNKDGTVKNGPTRQALKKVSIR